MRTQGLLLPVNANIQRVLSQTASGSSCPIVGLRWHGLDDSHRCRTDAGVAVPGWLQTFSGVNQTEVLRPKPPLDGAVVEFLSEHPKYLCSAPETYLSVEGAAHSVILTGKP